jgi:aspartyl/asparaginyl-tRNA synthetase
MKAWRRRLHEFDPPKDASHDNLDADKPRVLPSMREEGDDEAAPFWMLEDEMLMRKYGGSIKYHECMMEMLKKRIAAQCNESVKSFITQESINDSATDITACTVEETDEAAAVKTNSVAAGQKTVTVSVVSGQEQQKEFRSQDISLSTTPGIEE